MSALDSHIQRSMNNKKPGKTGFSEATHIGCLRYKALDTKKQLLNFGFFIHHVLTNYWVVFFEFQFSWRASFVFVCGIKMTGTRR